MHSVIMHMMIEPMLMYVFNVHAFMRLSDIHMLKHVLNVYEFLCSIVTFVLSVQ